MTAPALKPSEALRKARDLLTPEGAWTQRCYARLYANSPSVIDYNSENAKCWCALGATYRVASPNRTLRATCEEFLNNVVGGDIVDFNDAPLRFQEEVLDVFNRAIALAEAEGR